MSEQKETPSQLEQEQKSAVTNVKDQLNKLDSRLTSPNITFTQEEADKLPKEGIDPELGKKFRSHLKGSYPETDQK